MELIYKDKKCSCVIDMNERFSVDDPPTPYFVKDYLSLDPHLLKNTIEVGMSPSSTPYFSEDYISLDPNRLNDSPAIGISPPVQTGKPDKLIPNDSPPPCWVYR